MLLDSLRNFALGALDIILPRHCPVSGRPLMPDETGPVAEQIMRAVKLAGADYCSRCGAPQGSGVGAIHGCARCNPFREGFGTKEVVAVGDFEDELRGMCMALKFGGASGVAAPLAAWLTALIVDRGLPEKVDAVVVVPLHPFREFQRSYNQAALIAERVAAAIGKPFHARLLKRVKATQQQARLSAAQRRANLDGAFEVRPSLHAGIQGARLLLVDDIMTTGATLSAAARTLKRAGAKTVFGAVIARSTVGRDG